MATDSFRLAEKNKNENRKELKGIIIPFKNAMELSRIFEGESGVVDIRFNKNQIVFSLDHIYFTSRIIDGVFPDYKQIIPKEHKTEIVLLKQDFLNSLKISNIFSDKFNQVVIFVSPQKNIHHENKKCRYWGKYYTIKRGNPRGRVGNKFQLQIYY